jgi:hypothetical protein
VCRCSGTLCFAWQCTDPQTHPIRKLSRACLVRRHCWKILLEDFSTTCQLGTAALPFIACVFAKVGPLFIGWYCHWRWPPSASHSTVCLVDAGCRLTPAGINTATCTAGQLSVHMCGLVLTGGVKGCLIQCPCSATALLLTWHMTSQRQLPGRSAALLSWCQF